MTSTHDLESRQPDTIVITSVDTLKTAFLQWTEEQERQLLSAKKETNSHLYLVTRYKVGGKNCYKLSDIERIEGGHKR